MISWSKHPTRKLRRITYNLVVFSALVSSGFTEEKIRTKLAPFGDNGVVKSIVRTRIDCFEGQLLQA
jgi:hypothetical protein